MTRIDDRTWAKVEVPPNGATCWVWTAGKVKGYGNVAIGGGRSRSAHRVFYEAIRGPIPPHLQCDHLCRNRACVNPWHIELVTPGINTLRGISPSAHCARATHCIRGHEFTTENTYIRLAGGRQCRKCVVIRGRRYRQKKKIGDRK